METRNVYLGAGNVVERIDDYVYGRNERAAKLITQALGGSYRGDYNPQNNLADNPYYVPHKTIVGVNEARRLGIAGPEDLFGGVVPYGYMATKIIAHETVGEGSHTPENWSDAFPKAVRDVVLPGFSAFSARDAHLALEKLLHRGPVRTKLTLEAGGLGQTVITSHEELAQVLSTLPPKDLAQYGIVLETNLYDTATGSIGGIQLNGLRLSYYGEQRTYDDVKPGEESYAGSDLILYRGQNGTIADLLELGITDPVLQRAIQQAHVFDQATGHFAEAMISRRNYDTIVGRDTRGDILTGVLEQSWRIGGASGPEILAALEFQNNPNARVVRASSYHRFRERCLDTDDLPKNAVVFFDGKDSIEGRVQIYSMVHEVA